MSSPIFFSLFINDLVVYLKSKTDHNIFVSNDIDHLIALMFADDVSCFSDTVVRLQRFIDLIDTFCKSVGMKLNLSKTKIMVFRNGGIVKQIEKWFFEDEEIEIISIYKYLGLFFTPKLVWTKKFLILTTSRNKYFWLHIFIHKNIGRYGLVIVIAC